MEAKLHEIPLSIGISDAYAEGISTVGCGKDRLLVRGDYRLILKTGRTRDNADEAPDGL